MEVERSQPGDREYCAREDAEGHDNGDIRFKGLHCFCERGIFHGGRLEHREMMQDSDLLDGSRGEFLTTPPGFVRPGHNPHYRIPGLKKARQAGDCKVRCPHEENARGLQGMRAQAV